MREILFRGKSKSINKGEWIYGSFVEDTDLNACCIRDKSLVYELVDRKTVGQFTGLTDKKGKKIFEGDIVKATTGIEGYKSTYHSTIQEVKYNAEMCGIAVFLPFDNSDMVEIEVIGNLYDNPTLLRSENG